MTRLRINFAQGVLRGLGFQGLAMDGVWGPRTSDAVLAFQPAANRDHPGWNLAVDGVLGPRTLAALAWYWTHTTIGTGAAWNNLGTGLTHVQATSLAQEALRANPLSGLGSLPQPLRW